MTYDMPLPPSLAPSLPPPPSLPSPPSLQGPSPLAPPIPPSSLLPLTYLSCVLIYCWVV